MRPRFIRVSSVEEIDALTAWDWDRWELGGPAENPAPYVPVACACGRLIPESHSLCRMCPDC